MENIIGNIKKKKIISIFNNLNSEFSNKFSQQYYNNYILVFEYFRSITSDDSKIIRINYAKILANEF